MSLENGGVSIMTKSHPASRTAASTWGRRAAGTAVMARLSSLRVSFQNDALACGSRSNIPVLLPSRLASTASAVASVVLPTPPFCDTTERTFMLINLVFHMFIHINTHTCMLVLFHEQG